MARPAATNICCLKQRWWRRRGVGGVLVAVFRGLECGHGFKVWKHLPDKRHNTGRCPSQATLSLPFLSRTPKPFCFSLTRWDRGWLRLPLMGLGTAPRNSLARRAEAAGRRRGSHTYLAKAAGNRRGRISRTRTPAPRFLREGRQCAATPVGARGRLGPSTWRPRGSELPPGPRTGRDERWIPPRGHRHRGARPPTPSPRADPTSPSPRGFGARREAGLY